MVEISNKLKIKQRSLAELKPADYNPRKISDKQLEDLKQSFQNFGTMEPAIVNMHPKRLNIIISGHQRIRVAKELGLSTYPCIEVTLPERKEKELNIRMNKNTGEFDFDILVEEFDLGDLEDWGFEEQDLNIDSNPKEKEFFHNIKTEHTCPKCGYEW